MIRNTSKIISLLVAAASIMSVVPAMAATKLGTKDGTIENAVAFKDGKYLYQGYRTTDDNSGLYYNDGTKDKALDTADTIESDYKKYDNNTVSALNGSDEYLVDLAKGTISDDNTVSDYLDTATTKLQTKLDKTSRYGNKIGTDRKLSMTEVNQNRFGDIWYAYSAATTSSATTASAVSYATTSDAASYSGYTNNTGTYIDCSKDVNVYVYNGTRMLKLANLGDTDTSDGNTVTLKSIEYVKTLGQDKNYLYRLVKINVTGAKFINDTAAKTAGYTDTDAETMYAVQKISKAQGDTEKDAYLPKTTETYVLGSSNLGAGGSYMGDSDVKDAYGCLVSNSEVGAAGTLTYIVDGSIYTTFREDDEKVKTTRVDLKTSTKLEINGSSTTKVDGHVAIKNGDKDQKVGGSSYDTTYNNDAWAVDINGNVWAIKDGSVMESTKLGGFNTVYTTDRSFDRLDVYDENNLIAWKDGGDAYTNVAEGTKQAQDAAANGGTTTSAQVGWVQVGNAWTFYDAAGTKVVSNWVNPNGVWYYIGEDGNMVTGWKEVSGVWYYLDPSSGAMKTGWLQDGSTWYYLQSSGAMKTGWANDNGTWYYLSGSGAMLADTTTPDGYYVNASGAWV